MKGPLTARSKLSKQIHSGEAKFRLITTSIIVIVLAGILMWVYQLPTNVEDSEILETEVNKVEANDSIDNEIESKRVFHKSPDVYTEDIEAKTVIDVEEKAIIDVEEKELENIKEKLSEESIVEPVRENKSLSVITKPLQESSLSETTNATVKQKTSDGLVEFVANTGDDVLIVGTVSESWVEIQDATTPRLVFELIKSGGVYRVKGQAPFKVFLGNAPSVSLQLNGKAINILGFLRSGNIAHILIYKNGEVVAVSRKPNLQNEVSNEKPTEAVD